MNMVYISIVLVIKNCINPYVRSVGIPLPVSNGF